MKLIAEARAKINLAIDVLYRQEDGYHQVCMLLQSISLADRLFFAPRSQGISLSCSDPRLGSGETNLVYRAALALQDRLPHRPGAEIHVEKRIPMEAGLGGGSSDAAAALLALKELWHMDLSREDLEEIAFSLGADVPFCLTGGTALVQGVGERVKALPPFSCLALALVKPSFGLSTAGVYNSLDLDKVRNRPDFEALIAALGGGKGEEAFPHMVNVLEEGTGSKKRDIAALKEALMEAGALKALMSGSGSAVFGFFSGMDQAARAVSRFRSRGLWAETATLSPAGVEIKAR